MPYDDIEGVRSIETVMGTVLQCTECQYNTLSPEYARAHAAAHNKPVRDEEAEKKVVNVSEDAPAEGVAPDEVASEEKEDGSPDVEGQEDEETPTARRRTKKE
jgi:hypothetical protein